jgi:hypothetical protein
VGRDTRAAGPSAGIASSSSASSSSPWDVAPSSTITIEDEADDGLDFLERELLGEDEPMAMVMAMETVTEMTRRATRIWRR